MKSASGTDFVYMMCDDAYMYTEQPDGNIIWSKHARQPVFPIYVPSSCQSAYFIPDACLLTAFRHAS